MRVKLTIRMKMLGGFLVVAALVCVVAVAGNYYMSRVSEASEVYESAAPRETALYEIEVACQELRSIVTQHVSDPRPVRSWAESEEVRNADEEVRKHLDALLNGSEELGIDKPKDTEYIAAIQNLSAQYDSFFRLAQELYEGHTAEIVTSVPRDQWASSQGALNRQFTPQMTIGIGGGLEQVRAFIEEDVTTSYEDLKAAKTSASQMLLVALIAGPVLAIAIGLYISWSIMRPLKRAMKAMQHIAAGEVAAAGTLLGTDEISVAMNEMNATLAQKMSDLRQEQMRTAVALDDLQRVAGSVAESADEVAATAEQVSTTTTQISEGVELQAVATDQTSATIEEMAAAIDQVAGNAEILGTATDETAATIGEMTASIGAIAKTVDGLSTAVAETSASIEQMIVSIGQVAERAREVSGVTEKAVVASENGAGAVESMSKTMAAVVGAIENTAEVMKVLGRRSQEIGEIAEVIDDIAEQTNLLALNAAIEAARAGEHGRGFAVVAGAVRDLAERSTSSTKEISKLIESIREDTEEALSAVVRGVNEANESKEVSEQAKRALAHITDSFGEVRDAMRVIETATAEQVGGGKQVLGAVEEMRRLQESVDVAIQEQANGSRQIVETVDRMNMLVSGVVSATSEQKRGGEQMVLAVQNIADTTRQNVSAIQQLVQAAANLARQSEQMRALVQGFDGGGIDEPGESATLTFPAEPTLGEAV